MDRVTLHVGQGDDYAAVITVTDPTGAPVNLTGYTATAQVRRTFADLSPVEAEFSTQVGASTVTISLGKAQTIGLTSALYGFDVKLLDPDGARSTLLRGTVEVRGEVTRAEAVA